MANVSKRKIEVLERPLVCQSCYLPFKSQAALKSHFFYKHTDTPRVARTSPKHERLALEFIENAKRAKPFTKRQLLEISGYARNTATKNTSQPFSTQAFQDALAKRGFSPEKLLKIYEEAGDAKQGSWFQGEFYQDNAPDHATRLKAASGLADILGIKKRLIESKSVNVNLDSDGLRLMLGLG